MGRRRKDDAMKKIDSKTSWEAARTSTLFTLAALEASGSHGKLEAALGKQFAKWDTVEAARRDADDGIARANARVSVCDAQLDRAVKDFANELLRDAGGKFDDKTFRAYFPDAPSEVVRLGLESEIEACEKIVNTSAKVSVSKRANEHLTTIKRTMDEGRKVLAVRREAYAKQAQVALDIVSWKEATHAARESIFVALQTWGLDHGVGREYADAFFPDATRSRVKKAKAEPTGDAKGPAKPTE